MACKNCGPSVQSVCDCCKLVDGDEKFKLVTFCEMCNAYICASCKKNWVKRSVAYFLNKVKKKKKK